MTIIPTNASKVTVNGTDFLFWGDFIHRGTAAYNTETNETRWISEGGYIHKELTVRKAIAIAFNLPTFRTTRTEAKRVLTEEQRAKRSARAKARREARKAQAQS